MAQLPYLITRPDMEPKELQRRCEENVRREQVYRLQEYKSREEAWRAVYKVWFWISAPAALVAATAVLSIAFYIKFTS